MYANIKFYRPLFPANDRLQHEKLKNAILYWGGGVSSLQYRTHNMAKSVRESAPVVSELLDELSRYFRDLEKLLQDTYPEVYRYR